MSRQRSRSSLAELEVRSHSSPETRRNLLSDKAYRKAAKGYGYLPCPALHNWQTGLSVEQVPAKRGK